MRVHASSARRHGVATAASLGRSREASPLLRLQREAGNKAVAGLLVQREGGGGSAPKPAATPAAAGSEVSAGSNAPAATPAALAASGGSGGGSPAAVPAGGGSAGGGVATAVKTPETLVHEAGDSWSTVKSRHKNDAPTMRRLVAFRKTEVDALLADMMSRHRVTTRSSGSDALTSDYDVTFLGSASAAAAAVSGFNKAFSDRWGKESGTVFDTNVYAEDFLGKKPDAGVREDEATAMSSGSQQQEAALQDTNALVKARKNMTATEWSAFVSRIVTGLPASGTIRQETERQFAAADAVYRNTYVAAMIRQLAADPAGRNKIAELRQQKAGITDQEIMETLETGAEGVRAANRIYEAKLAEVGRLETARDQLTAAQRGPLTRERWSEATLLIRQAKSEAMLFANEPYFSAGTLYHVVGNLQQTWGTDLGTAEYFQSANENFGDFKKEISHHRHGAHGADQKKDFLNFAVQSSKYAFRFFDAASQLSDKGVAFTSNVKLLRSLEERLLAIRQGEALDEDMERIDQKAIGAKRDEQGTLRYEPGSQAGEAGEEIETLVDYSKVNEQGKLQDAEGNTAAMGVTTIEGLDTLMSNVNIEMNVSTRSSGKHRPPPS